ncbi:hypothetical protein ACCAA_1170024 [Candidatus Accumulibacter aalborgensis]|uniref:Uncharacterized protein n=1 Tax=Candidatus Accumulibacter aalborgensis TaxID=1860102 RepID=A0A1A8XGQ0_9PROT|nr:hypothetical protein ACCAA_1170024 [Candidatus Accumulibacter aalborgensis]
MFENPCRMSHTSGACSLTLAKSFSRSPFFVWLLKKTLSHLMLPPLGPLIVATIGLLLLPRRRPQMGFLPGVIGERSVGTPLGAVANVPAQSKADGVLGTWVECRGSLDGNDGLPQNDPHKRRKPV